MTPCPARAIRHLEVMNPVASVRGPRTSVSQPRRTMSTPPPRAGQTAADVTGRPQGRDRAAPGPYGSAQSPAAGHGRQPGSHRAQPPGPGGARPPGDGQGTGSRPDVENVNVVRSSGVMALGTLASRGTGFLRTLVIAYVLGVAGGLDRVQQRQHAAERGVRPDARRHPDQRRGAAARQRREAGRRRRRGLRPADVHPGHDGAGRAHPGRHPGARACWWTCTRTTSRRPSTT